MPGEIFLQTLADLRRGALRLGAALGLYALCVMALYPAGHAHARGWLGTLPNLLSGRADAFSDPSSWMNAVGFRLVFPLFVCLYAIWAGTHLMAGEKRGGVLELLLSYPLPRWRLLLEMFCALALALGLLSAGLWALLALSVVSLGLNVPLSGLTGACTGLALLGLTYGGLAFALASSGKGQAGSRRVAAGALAGAYLLSALWLNGAAFFRYLSPFYYATGRDPLTNGLLPGHGLALALLCAGCLLAAGVLFERSDLAG